MTQEKSRGLARKTFAAVLASILAAAPLKAAPLEFPLEAPAGERPANENFSPSVPVSFNELESPLENLDFEPRAPVQDAKLAPQLSEGEKNPSLIRDIPSLGQEKTSAIRNEFSASPVRQAANPGRKRRMAENIIRVKQALGRWIKKFSSGNLEDEAEEGQVFDRLLSEDGAARNAQADLPPTSFPESLGQADLNRAASVALADEIKSGLESPHLAGALSRLVFKDKPKKGDWEILAKALKKNPGISPIIFLSVYNNLESIVFSEKPAWERAAVASYVAKRYARFLAQAAQEKSLPAFFRNRAAESEKVLADGSLVQALILARQAHNKLIPLNALIPKDAKDAESGEDGLMIPSWEIPQPTTRSEREKIREEKGARQTILYAMPDTVKEIAAYSFAAEQALSRIKILGGRSFSEKFKERIQDDLKKTFSDVRSLFFYDDSLVTRFRNITIFKGFLKRKTRKTCSRAIHEGLQMVERSGNFVIRAHFLTDIPDEAVLRAVKASIEDYWRGEFSYRGKNYRIETQVSFEPIASRKMIAENVLQLLDGGNANSSVSGSIVSLQRDFNYGTPAHEFGHILGLNDEYFETYDFSRHALESLVTMDSLMNSSGTGETLPRHFKTAYQLQRRRAGK